MLFRKLQTTGKAKNEHIEQLRQATEIPPQPAPLTTEEPLDDMYSTSPCGASAEAQE